MRIVVFGWYSHGNLGDEAFKPAIQNLFPNHQFTFTDKILPSINQDYDMLWVGGGSFLDQKISGIENIKIPLGFIGVGIGSSIEANNIAALKRAKFVIVRDSASLQYCANAYLAPDIVLSRKDIVQRPPKLKDAPKKVAILLNDFFYPGWGCHEWQNVSYQLFAFEFAKVCESLISKGYHLQFLPMCISPGIDDRKIAGSIIGKLKNKYKTEWVLNDKITEEEMLNQLGQSDLVVTQRLHAAIYAILLNKPFIVLKAHDKLKGLVEDCNWPGHLNYYGFTDQEFFNVMKQINGKTVTREYISFAQKRWGDLAEIIVK